MSSASTHSTDQSQIEQARRQINRLAEEIAQLSEMEISPSEYYNEFLQRVLAALQAEAGAIWLRTAQGNLICQCQVRMHEVGLDRAQESRPMHDELLRQAITQQKGGIIPPQSARAVEGAAPDTMAGNPTDYVILLAPIFYDKAVTGLLEVWQDPTRPADAQRGFLQFMVRMAALASGFLKNNHLKQMVGQQQIWTQMEAFSRQVHGSLNPIEVSFQVANEGRRLCEVDRISVAIREGDKCQVKAISGADVVEKRSNLVMLMRALFNSVVQWGEKLVYTGTIDDTLPPKVHKALDAYLAESNSKLLVLTPLMDDRDKDTKKKARSALLLECFEPLEALEVYLGKMEVIAKHAGPALYNSAEHRRIPMRFIWMPLAYVQDGMGGQAKAITALVIAGLTFLTLALIFVPYQLKMEATGQILPIQRRNLYAPVPGQIQQFMPGLVSGSKVSNTHELITMFDTKLADEIRQLKTDIANSEAKMITLAPKGGGDNDRENAVGHQEARITLAAKQDQFRELVQRTGADPIKMGYFYIKTPLDGFVLSSDFRDLVGKRVQPSEPLLKVGAANLRNPKASEWEIELKIPQKHVGQVLSAFNYVGKNELDVDFILNTRTTSLHTGKLRKDKIAAQANPHQNAQAESEPVVLAWVRITGDDIPEAERLPVDLLLAGTEVRSRIRCGNHAMGYSLFYGVWEFIYEKFVFFF